MNWKTFSAWQEKLLRARIGSMRIALAPWPIAWPWSCETIAGPEIAGIFSTSQNRISDKARFPKSPPPPPFKSTQKEYLAKSFISKECTQNYDPETSSDCTTRFLGFCFLKNLYGKAQGSSTQAKYLSVTNLQSTRGKGRSRDTIQFAWFFDGFLSSAC